ncbi:MAG: hypothetical protein EA383_13815 [Spirochaetaceae bacterium]|jgi:hypothetical protein|nr:MAG: hypothetical protein EA383_13815 [Spirochaetaceae bacterium]
MNILNKYCSGFSLRYVIALITLVAAAGTASGQFLDPRLNIHLDVGAGFLVESMYQTENELESDDIGERINVMFGADVLYFLGQERTFGIGGSFRNLTPYEGLTISTNSLAIATSLRSERSDLVTQIQVATGVALFEYEGELPPGTVPIGLSAEVGSRFYLPLFEVAEIGTLGTAMIAPSLFGGMNVLIGGIANPDLGDDDTISSPYDDVIINVFLGLGVTITIVD